MKRSCGSHLLIWAELLFLLGDVSPETELRQNSELFKLLHTVFRLATREHLPQRMLQVGNTKIDLRIVNRIQVNGQDKKLSPATFKIIKKLMLSYFSKENKPVLQYELGHEFGPEELTGSQVRVYVSRARQELEVVGSDLKIVSVAGTGGYVLGTKTIITQE